MTTLRRHSTIIPGHACMLYSGTFSRRLTRIDYLRWPVEP
jgi:hypothetical protein